MYLKPAIKVLTVALLTDIASSRNLQVPVNRTVGAETQVYWTVNPADHPSWTLFLMDPTYIWGLYAILGENVDNSLGHVNIAIPATLDPKLDYVLKAVNPDNVDMIWYTSLVFKVLA